MAQPTVTLSDKQVAQFHRDGFVVVEQVSPPDELAWMRDVYDRLFNDRTGWDEGRQFNLGGRDDEDQVALPQLLGPEKNVPQLNDTVYAANVLAITKQLLGDVADKRGGHMILKPAGYGAPTPWHQDEAYWNPLMQYQTTNFWMPLEDATVDSGCLWFLPRSNHWEVVEHQSIGGDPAVHGLEFVPGLIDTSEAVACPVPAGGCTIHANRTAHYAGPNKTDRPRRAYIRGGGIPPRQRTTPRRFPWEERKQTARAQRAEKAQT